MSSLRKDIINKTVVTIGCLAALLSISACAPEQTIAYQIPGATTFVFHPGGYDSLEFHPEAMKGLIEPKCRQKLAVERVDVFLVPKLPDSDPRIKNKAGVCIVDYPTSLSSQISKINCFVAGARWGTNHQIHEPYWFNYVLMHEILVHACATTQEMKNTRLPDDFNEEQKQNAEDYYLAKYLNQEPVFIFTQK